MPKTKIAVRIDQELLEQLKMVAEGNGVNESDLIREAVSEYLTRFQSGRSYYDISSAIGIIGADMTMDSDLSIAKRHMKG
jgi:metal-responsive CopG/Arc/MetJ family transcriptional regulator